MAVDWQRARELALQLAMEVAPDGKVQQAFSQIAQTGELDYRQDTKILVTEIFAGVRHGRWPQVADGEAMLQDLHGRVA